MRHTHAFILILPVILWCLTAYQNTANAHPFHTSTAEIEYNRKSDRLEVGLRLHAIDLEKALKIDAKKDIKIGAGETFEEAVEQYLRKHFYIAPISALDEKGDTEKSANKLPRSELEYAGHEVENTWIWIFFEMELPEDRSQLGIRNSVLLEVTEDQINTMSVRNGSTKGALRTDRKKNWTEFEAKWIDGR